MAKHRGLESQGRGLPPAGLSQGDCALVGALRDLCPWPESPPPVLLTCWSEDVASELCRCIHCPLGASAQRQRRMLSTFII